MISDEWVRDHFDYLAPEFASDLHPTLERMRGTCPFAHSDQRGGYWIATKYDDVVSIAQDWQTFSSYLGVSIPHEPITLRPIPELTDPPLHRAYKRIINAHFTPAAVAPYHEPTRALVTRMIDAFVERGECDFMTEFAAPFPGLAFFDLVLGAPADRLRELNRMATGVSNPTNPDRAADWQGLGEWIQEFVETRRGQPPRADVVDAIINADIDGRPIRDDEVLGLIVLLILGGLETTAGALGHFMLRFCREPGIPELLRDRPDVLNEAVEELLRLETSFIAVGRTVRDPADLHGNRLEAGEKVMISWASANRDEDEFERPHEFVLDRARNRHLAFGAGPHRCAGSNLARLNLRIAVREIVDRMRDLELTIPESDVPFHHAYNRSPLSMPIRFRPGAASTASTVSTA